MTRDITLSPQDLAVLGVDIARDGFAPHESAIADLVARLRGQSPRWSVLDVLADTTKPSVVRARALALVSRRRPGPSVRRKGIEMAANRFDPTRSDDEPRDRQQSPEPAVRRRDRERFEASFDRLLRAAGNHHDLRVGGGPIGTLAESRARLDSVRLEVTRNRRQLTMPRPAAC